MIELLGQQSGESRLFVRPAVVLSALPQVSSLFIVQTFIAIARG
jgi:hypothetical protein